jgi:hypothetical protein
MLKIHIQSSQSLGLMHEHIAPKDQNIILQTSGMRHISSNIPHKCWDSGSLWRYSFKPESDEVLPVVSSLSTRALQFLDNDGIRILLMTDCSAAVDALVVQTGAATISPFILIHRREIPKITTSVHCPDEIDHSITHGRALRSSIPHPRLSLTFPDRLNV